jgi:hypothetical protein
MRTADESCQESRGEGCWSSSMMMRTAGVSRSSNWPLPTAQKKAQTAPASSSSASGIRK